MKVAITSFVNLQSIPRLSKRQELIEEWPKPTEEQLAKVKRITLPPLRGAGGLMEMEFGVRYVEARKAFDAAFELYLAKGSA